MTEAGLSAWHWWKSPCTDRNGKVIVVWQELMSTAAFLKRELALRKRDMAQTRVISPYIIHYSYGDEGRSLSYSSSAFSNTENEEDLNITALKANILKSS